MYQDLMTRTFLSGNFERTSLSRSGALYDERGVVKTETKWIRLLDEEVLDRLDRLLKNNLEVLGERHREPKGEGKEGDNTLVRQPKETDRALRHSY